MLVKFRNGYFITFSTHKTESDGAGAQAAAVCGRREQLGLAVSSKNKTQSPIKQLGSGWMRWVTTKHFGGGGEGQPRSETWRAQEQNISAQ